MSLYQLSKVIYQLNRDETLVGKFKQNPQAVVDEYDLTPEEREALLQPDIGLLYVLGVNGQILMHYAALWEIPWAEYLQLMRDGIKKHGQVRAGIYTLTTSPDEVVVK
jgi:hypothetical protein